MAVYKAPVRDMQFVLNEVFLADNLWQSMPDTEEVSGDVVEAILTEGAKIAENLLLPLNQSGDEVGCQFENGVVTTPAGFKEAYQQLADGGWVGLGGNPEFGGQGMPKMLTVLFEEMLYAANTAFTLYPILSAGFSLALNSHASQEIKQKYLPKMYSGQWAGTMCLTEPHAGSDLGIIRTKAIPNADGAYEITGTKIFITGGEHDLTENILHLVLAKLPDSPAGSKGISLFLVPKFFVNDDDSLGERNQVSCGSIEHKMGIKGSATCVVNFDGAIGWLVGEINQGLACMFTMMNYERLSIGIQGLGLGEIAYQSAASYAKERLQGRAVDGPKNPDKYADNLLVHPDVRRMLLSVRAYNEAGRAFAVYVGMQLDIAKFHPNETKREYAADLVALLTPIVKSFFTDKGLEMCIMSQQVLGGHGYVKEWGLEQFVRDARIAQIYEGTNGIQAMDLVGRKVFRNQGQYVELFLSEMKVLLSEIADDSSLQCFYSGLKSTIEICEKTTQQLIASAKKDPNYLGAVAVDYLNLLGLTSYAYMWTKMAKVALQQVDQDDTGFYQNKLIVGEFFIQRLLPQVYALQISIDSGSSAIMKMGDEAF